MQLYRIAKTKYIRDLSGSGARMYGGRWNLQGTPALYTSEHRSLAILEFLVHCSPLTLPPDLSIVTLSIPGKITPDELAIADLPSGWRTYPAPGRLAHLGTDWLHSGAQLLLRVPSVVVPEEWNLIVNPAHERFEDIEIREVSTFDLDSRFLSTD